MATKVDTLLEFYAKLLSDVGVFDKDGGGLLFYNHAVDDARPVTINGTRLCLPTRELVRDGDWNARTAFHPLSEQINQGPSPVLNAFKSYVTEVLKGRFQVIALELAELAADAKRHKALTTKSAKFLTGLVGFDDTTATALHKVFKQVSEVPEKRMIGIFLQNGGTPGALRSCNVAFPILDGAESEQTEEFFGVKMPRKTKDKQLIVTLLQYVLGNAKDYASEVKISDAPYFETLLLSFQALAKRVNGLIDLHGKACPDLQALRFDLEWAVWLEDFNTFVEKYGVAVPALPGNVGFDPEPEDDEEVAEVRSPFEATADQVGETSDLPWYKDGEKRDVPSRNGGSGLLGDRTVAEDTRGAATRQPDRELSVSEVLRNAKRREEPGSRGLFDRDNGRDSGIRLGGRDSGRGGFGGGRSGGGLGGSRGKAW